MLCRCSEVSKELAEVKELARVAQGGVTSTKAVVDALSEDLVKIAHQVPQVFNDLRIEMREEVTERKAVELSIWEALEAVEPVVEQLRRELQGVAAKASVEQEAFVGGAAEKLLAQDRLHATAAP